MSIGLTRKRLILLSGLTVLGSAVLGSVAGDFGLIAIAQSNERSLSLLNMAEFYTGLPHQTRALNILQSQIDQTHPELLQEDSITANVWRDSATLAGYDDILNTIPVAQRTGSDPLDMALAISRLTLGGTDNIEMIAGPGAENPTEVIITVSDSGLLDDSLAGIRYQF